MAELGRAYLTKQSRQLFPGRVLMRAKVALLAIFVAAPSWAQSIEVTGIEEKGAVVELRIETDIEPPFEVMAGIGLAGQADDDIWIGNNSRQTITSSTQTLTVQAKQRGERLPSGTYEAEVDFYPRWGAKSSPPSTQAISKQIRAVKPFVLKGSGASATDHANKQNLRKWVMLNTAIGDPFDLSAFQQRLGESRTIIVANRNNVIVGHYFPAADMTLFENILKGTLVTWREGRVDRL